MIVLPKNRCPSRGLMDPFILVLRIQIWGHTDQVLVYIEDHSKGTWVMREYHTRSTVGTAGKEKDKFTAQLTVFKDGTKVRGFLIQS